MRFLVAVDIDTTELPPPSKDFVIEVIEDAFRDAGGFHVKATVAQTDANVQPNV